MFLWYDLHVWRGRRSRAVSTGTLTLIETCTYALWSRPRALETYSSTFPCSPSHVLQVVTQTLCLPLSKHWLKHMWEGEGSRAGHSQLLILVILGRVWFTWVFSLLLKVQVRVYTDKGIMQRVLTVCAGAWRAVSTSTTLPHFCKRTGPLMARQDSTLSWSWLSASHSLLSQHAALVFKLSVCAMRHA